VIAPETAGIQSVGGRSKLSREEMIVRLGAMEDIIIDQIVLDQTQARITMSGLPDRPGLAAQMFERIAKECVLVDMIVQSVGHEGLASISFTVSRSMLSNVLAVCEELSKEFGSTQPTHNPAMAKLSVFGTGLRSHTGLAYRMFKTMSDAGINVNLINTSEMCVDISVNDADGRVTARQIMLYAAALLPISLLPTLMAMAGVVYFIAAFTLSIAFVACSLPLLRAHDCCSTQRSARRVFIASILYLPLLLIAMLVDRIVAVLLT